MVGAGEEAEEEAEEEDGVTRLPTRLLSMPRSAGHRLMRHEGACARTPGSDWARLHIRQQLPILGNSPSDGAWLWEGRPSGSPALLQLTSSGESPIGIDKAGHAFARNQKARTLSTCSSRRSSREAAVEPPGSRKAARHRQRSVRGSAVLRDASSSRIRPATGAGLAEAAATTKTQAEPTVNVNGEEDEEEEDDEEEDEDEDDDEEEEFLAAAAEDVLAARAAGRGSGHKGGGSSHGAPSTIGLGLSAAAPVGSSILGKSGGASTHALSAAMRRAIDEGRSTRHGRARCTVVPCACMRMLSCGPDGGCDGGATDGSLSPASSTCDGMACQEPAHAP
jgi:hypothetical protein